MSDESAPSEAPAPEDETLIPPPPAGGEIVLSATDLVAGYTPEVNILNGCDLHLADGELIAIIGPNGAGKSTLLKALFGLVKVSSGDVTFRGEVVTGEPAHSLVAKGIGYVPQNNNVFPRLTVEENLEMGMYLEPKRFKERLGVVSDLFPLLSERLKQRAGSLSGGERQMLAMGRALVLEPELLLLDEPTEGIQPNIVHEIGDIIMRLNREADLTVLLVEQKLPFARRVATQLRILDKGRLVVSGGIADLTDELVKQHLTV